LCQHGYNTNNGDSTLQQDMIAGLVVGIVVIPQSLGYALLAGLPPVYGLYGAIIPVLVYAFIGASNTQAVGPVAITSIMTAQALVPFAQSSK
jgi:SulP family sulfate permease